MENVKKVLALSPHTDDIEIGCGATLKKLKDAGAEITVVNFAFSKNGNNIPENIKQEFEASMSLLEAKSLMLNLPVRNLASYRQVILNELYDLKKNEYDLVFCHSSYDCHQDHITVREEAFRAFKNTTILGYEMPWNCREFKTDLFVSISEEQLKFKTKLLNCYKSQSHRPYMFVDYTEALAKTRGLVIGEKYAECFEVIRQVWR